MTPERYKKVGALFHAALELSPVERAAFLDQQCADDVQLKREVESLIASHNEASDFIGSPAMSVAAELLLNNESDELIGKTVGRYSVRSLLGAGGMGRVYLAEDLELGRLVALKVLVKAFTHDEKQLQRFRQEARAASALNHPNILTVHEIGQVDGTYFIATEYVEGETLRDRLQRSPIILNEASDIATQIADALVAAHTAGIVHRDIKPENVMLRRDGYVKVLDFGLAKLTEKVSGSDAPQSLKGIVRTDSGVIMGTVYYMSPEQVRGVGVDARTDVWSLGVLLYELVAHRRPFEEESRGDTIVSILQGETASLLDNINETPAELQSILKKALAKNIDERYQTAQEMATDLRQLKRKLEVDSPIALTGAVVAASSTGDRKHAQTSLVQSAKSTSSLEFAVNEIKRHKTAVALAVVFFIAALGASALGIYKFIGKDKPARIAEPLKVIPLTTLPGVERSPAFSPDGKQVAFAWTGEHDDNFDIYVQLIGVGEPLRLTTSPRRDMSPTWSPDGRYIAFLRGTGEDKGFYMVPALGGAERKLTDAYGWEQRAALNQAVAWSPAGSTLALVDKSAEDDPWSIYLLSIETGERRKFTTPPTPSDADTTVAFSPDGGTLAFVRSHNVLGGDVYFTPGDIYLAPVTGGDPVRLTFGERAIEGLAWTSDGKELVFSSEHGETGRPILLRVSAAGGAPARVVERSGDAVFDPAISSQGNRLAFAQMSYDFNIYRVEVTDQPAGRRKASTPTMLISSTRTESDPRYSPDGQKVVFISNRSGNSNMWVVDADGKNPAQLTDGLYVDTPAWSPDGHLIAFNSVVGGNSDIYTIGADAGVVRRLTTDPSAETTPSWSPDGNWLYFSSNRTGRAEVWKMAAAGGAAAQLTRGGGFNPVAAPDGRTVYYLHGEEEPWLWAVSAEGGAEAPAIDGAPGQVKWMELTNWAVAGRGIYFLEGKLGTGYTLEFFDFETRRTTPLMTLMKLRGPRSPFAMIGLTVAPDERSILYAQRDNFALDLMLIENFH
jgi:Tol biopolymer transport system component/serine/threonine protein kinase